MEPITVVFIFYSSCINDSWNEPKPTETNVPLPVAGPWRRSRSLHLPSRSAGADGSSMVGLLVN